MKPSKSNITTISNKTTTSTSAASTTSGAVEQACKRQVQGAQAEHRAQRRDRYELMLLPLLVSLRPVLMRMSTAAVADGCSTAAQSSLIMLMVLQHG